MPLSRTVLDHTAVLTATALTLVGGWSVRQAGWPNEVWWGHGILLFLGALLSRLLLRWIPAVGGLVATLFGLGCAAGFAFSVLVVATTRRFGEGMAFLTFGAGCGLHVIALCLWALRPRATAEE